MVKEGKFTLQEWEFQNLRGPVGTAKREDTPASPDFSTWALGGHILTRCDWLKQSVDSFPITDRQRDS